MNQVEERTIFFNEKLHTYTDNCGNKYTSMTTCIDKYVEKFDSSAVAKACERIGKNPNHPKYSKYKGKTYNEIKLEWELITKEALVNGTEKHDYLEHTIKRSNGYKLIEDSFINDKIYTIRDIIENNSFGTIDINYFISTGIASRYPKIFATLNVFVEQGWKLYSEIGVYNTYYLISGLIDLLLIKDDKFIIIDWKTNKADIKFESGYFEKDMNGNLTDTFIQNNKNLKYPLNNLSASVGHKYGLQLSGYTFMVEQFGFKNLGNILFQIRENKSSYILDINNNYSELEKVDVIAMPNLTKEVEQMFIHHRKGAFENTQIRIFN